MAVSPNGQIGDRVRMNASKADQENATAHLHWVAEKIAKEVKLRTATAQIPAPKVRKEKDISIVYAKSRPPNFLSFILS